MARVYISVGSNIDRHINICAGLNALKQRYGKLQLSSVYETKAVGFDGDPFFNLVVALDTGESPQAINRFLKAVEDMQERKRQQEKFSPRTLDMDLLLYGDKQMDQPGLKIPHEDIFKYAFVLEPLAEIAPEIIYPGETKTFAKLWRNYKAEKQFSNANIIDWQIF